MNAVFSMEMLSLKQVFVRYVSHEIRYYLRSAFSFSDTIYTYVNITRSPLNVVHAGLDILRDELRDYIAVETATQGNSSNQKGLLGLVEDMFAASDSAITILNDLLNYENMDAGRLIFLSKFRFFPRFCCS